MIDLKTIIEQHCPDGVDFKKIDDVCKTVSPKIKIKSREYLSEGKYPVIDQGSDFIGGYTNEEGAFPQGEYVIFGDHTCVVKFIDFMFVQGADGVKVLKANEGLIPKYLYYCMDNIKMDSDYSRHWSKMKNIEIPVPPVVVQEAVVEFLDLFTDLIIELKKELDERKLQYQYYIDKVFGIDQKTQEQIAASGKFSVLALNEVGQFTRGKRFVKADSVDEGTPCVHYGELYTYYGVSATKTKSFLNPELASKLRFAKKDDVIIVAAGENNIDIGVGVAWLGDESIAVHDACYIFSHKENPKYISYYLRSSYYHKQIKKYVADGKVCSISDSGIGKATIPMPTLEVQNEIVKELDCFDTLCNDNLKGIPAEIQQRELQYKHYREEVLNFKRK